MEKRFKNFLISILRKSTFKWHTRQKAYIRAKVKIGEYSTGKPKFNWKCAICGELFKSKETVMDHVDPVVPISGYKSGREFDLEEYVYRMFPPEETGWNCVCKICHDKKTKKENELRRANKK